MSRNFFRRTYQNDHLTHYFWITVPTMFQHMGINNPLILPLATVTQFSLISLFTSSSSRDFMIHYMNHASVSTIHSLAPLPHAHDGLTKVQSWQWGWLEKSTQSCWIVSFTFTIMLVLTQYSGFLYSSIFLEYYTHHSFSAVLQIPTRVS